MNDPQHDTGISAKLEQAKAERDAANAELPQAKRTSRPLTPDERTNGTAPEAKAGTQDAPRTIQISQAQLRRLTTLEAQAQNAQNALKGFVQYICDEYDIEDIRQWTIMQDGRMVKKQADGGNGESESPGSG